MHKRLYRPGFTLFRHGKVIRSAEVATPQLSQLSSSFQDKADHIDTLSAALVTTRAENENILLIKTSAARFSPQRSLSFIKPVLIHRSPALFLTLTPNSVSKAGFRTFIYSLILFGGALYCFFNVPGLVYVTAGLLIMAFVFCLVSLLTSVSARHDKINNSKGWLTMSLITFLLDILEIAAIVIFFIALF